MQCTMPAMPLPLAPSMQLQPNHCGCDVTCSEVLRLEGCLIVRLPQSALILESEQLLVLIAFRGVQQLIEHNMECRCTQQYRSRDTSRGTLPDAAKGSFQYAF